jgi:phosphate starvation-inducible PhoH-like protein|nr:MAG TPA: PhoH-like protein [Caudoviricetes sp.]
MRFDNDKEISLKNSKDRDRFYSKMSEEQKLFFHSIKENIFTFCGANAGTGKSHVSVAAMIDMLANGEIDKIVYIQKASERYLEHGFLPGGIEEKTEALWTPFYDAMLTLGYFPEIVNRMVQQGIIHLTTDATLRGVNFENAGIIIEEAENCNEETLRLIFTRCHDSCHVVMIGDVKQKDNKGRNDDFVRYGDYLANSKLGNKCYLTKNYRGKFSQLAENYGG